MEEGKTGGFYEVENKHRVSADLKKKNLNILYSRMFCGQFILLSPEVMIYILPTLLCLDAYVGLFTLAVIKK